jgi:hypothetical protein
VTHNVCMCTTIQGLSLDFIKEVKSRQVVLPDGTVRTRKKTSSGDDTSSEKKVKRRRRGKKKHKDHSHTHSHTHSHEQQSSDVFDFLNKNTSISHAPLVDDSTRTQSNRVGGVSSSASGESGRGRSGAATASLGILSLGEGEEKLVQRMVSEEWSGVEWIGCRISTHSLTHSVYVCVCV